MNETAYPLAWPPGWKRSAVGDRTPGHFGTRKASTPGGYPYLRDITIAQSVDRVLAELVRMGIPRDDIIISTNLRVRRDGFPISDQRAPDDPGAAVYWRDGAHQRCMAIDRYTKVEDNLAAIAATVEAMRAIERHGGAVILDRAFTGFTALPSAIVTERPWAEVLGVPDNSVLDVIQTAYRRLAGLYHPDREGGDAAKMSELNRAWERAQAARRG